MRNYAILFLVSLIASASWATNSSLNLAIPTPGGSYQSDRIRSGEIDCSNAIGGGTNLEFGVTGLISRDQDPLSTNYGQQSGRDVGVYARITIPLDGPKERINCNTLYELELTRKRMEIEKLQQEIRKLRNLQFEN